MISKWTGEYGGNKTCISYARNGIFISGPDGTLKYFKRQKYVWNEIFHQPTTNAFAMLKGYNDNESAIGTTVDGGLYKILLTDNDKMSITKIKSYDVSFKFFALVNPAGDFLVAVDSTNEIHVMCIEKGSKVAEIQTNKLTILQSNPKYPFIAVGNEDGDVTCVSVFDPKNPKVLTEFLLSRQKIIALKFSESGNFLIAIDAGCNCFVIKSIPGDKMTILRHFKEEFFVIDFFAVETREKLEIFLLFDENSLFEDEVELKTDGKVEGKSTNKNRIVKIFVELAETDEVSRETWKLPGSYRSILPMSSETESFYAIRSNSQQVEILNIIEDSVHLASVIATPHQLKHIEGSIEGNHLITWSMDGIAAVYNIKKNHEVVAAFVAGNRHCHGVKIAHCNSKCELMVTLDHSGNLICSRLNIDKSPKVKSDFKEALEKAQEKIAGMFSLTTSGGFPGLSMEHFGKKFTDLKSEQTYQMEARESEQTRKLLFEKLQDLQLEIKKMLDENEKITDDEKLEVQEFNLDLVTTAEKNQMANGERDQEEKKMMDYIEAQTTMNDWIVEKCWNPMKVKGIKLRGMFSGLFVDNYPLLKEEDSDEMSKIKLMRSIENSVGREDAFLPWRPIPTM